MYNGDMQAPNSPQFPSREETEKAMTDHVYALNQANISSIPLFTDFCAKAMEALTAKGLNR